MDEFHYYADPQRGWAWQVPLLELCPGPVPAHVSDPGRHEPHRRRPHPPHRPRGRRGHQRIERPCRSATSGRSPTGRDPRARSSRPTGHRSTWCRSPARPRPRAGPRPPHGSTACSARREGRKVAERLAGALSPPASAARCAGCCAGASASTTPGCSPATAASSNSSPRPGCSRSSAAPTPSASASTCRSAPCSSPAHQVRRDPRAAAQGPGVPPDRRAGPGGPASTPAARWSCRHPSTSSRTPAAWPRPVTTRSRSSGSSGSSRAAGQIVWTEATFDKLVAAAPEAAPVPDAVDNAMILNVIARPGDPVAALSRLVRDNHETAGAPGRLARRGIRLCRSLLDSGVITRLAAPTPTDARSRSLSTCPRTSPSTSRSRTSRSKPSTCSPPSPPPTPSTSSRSSSRSSTTRNPFSCSNSGWHGARPSPGAQGRRVDYDERMELLDEVTWPKPLADLLGAAYAAYRHRSPVAPGGRAVPKSVVREMWETGDVLHRSHRPLRPGPLRGGRPALPLRRLPHPAPDRARRAPLPRAARDRRLARRDDPPDRLLAARRVGGPDAPREPQRSHRSSRPRRPGPCPPTRPHCAPWSARRCGAGSSWPPATTSTACMPWSRRAPPSPTRPARSSWSGARGTRRWAPTGASTTRSR
jgi:hypothetical protein